MFSLNGTIRTPVRYYGVFICRLPEFAGVVSPNQAERPQRGGGCLMKKRGLVLIKTKERQQMAPPQLETSAGSHRGARDCWTPPHHRDTHLSLSLCAAGWMCVHSRTHNHLHLSDLLSESSSADERRQRYMFHPFNHLKILFIFNLKFLSLFMCS